MAIVDKLNTFATNLSPTNNTSTNLFGDFIDTGSTNGPGGGDVPLWLMVHVTDAGTPHGSTTFIDFIVMTDADGSAGSSVEVARFRLPKADVVLGKTYYWPVSGGKQRWLRYVGVYTYTDYAWTGAGAFTVALTTEPDTALQ